MSGTWGSPKGWVALLPLLLVHTQPLLAGSILCLQLFSAAVHGSTPSNPEVWLQFGPYSHVLASQGLLEVTPKPATLLGLSGSTKSRQKTSGPLSLFFFLIPDVVDTAKFCC